MTKQVALSIFPLSTLSKTQVKTLLSLSSTNYKVAVLEWKEKHSIYCIYNGGGNILENSRANIAQLWTILDHRLALENLDCLIIQPLTLLQVLDNIILRLIISDETLNIGKVVLCPIESRFATARNMRCKQVQKIENYEVQNLSEWLLSTDIGSGYKVWSICWHEQAFEMQWKSTQM